MATPSRFNRPYAELPGGTGSLANRAATPVGRGYYDPQRILERVARGRPGTTTQQAAAASEAYGMDVISQLMQQMGMPAGNMTEPQVVEAPPTTPAVATPAPTNPNNQPGPWSTGLVTKKKAPMQDYMGQFKLF
jgi:hypothetical protein